MFGEIAGVWGVWGPAVTVAWGLTSPKSGTERMNKSFNSSVRKSGRQMNFTKDCKMSVLDILQKIVKCHQFQRKATPEFVTITKQLPSFHMQAGCY